MSLLQSIPEPKRYLIAYERGPGDVQSYEVSLPISKDDKKFTAYCFSRRGVRSFTATKVRSMKEIRVVGKLK